MISNEFGFEIILLIPVSYTHRCEHSVEVLASLTNPMTQPWFVELSGVIENEMLTITVVMNVKIMKNSSIINHLNYSVFINGEWYSNRNHRHQASEVLLQTYSIPQNKIDIRRMYITIRDNQNDICLLYTSCCIDYPSLHSTRIWIEQHQK